MSAKHAFPLSPLRTIIHFWNSNKKVVGLNRFRTKGGTKAAIGTLEGDNGGKDNPATAPKMEDPRMYKKGVTEVAPKDGDDVASADSK